jgi:hypothetical protein
MSPVLFGFLSDATPISWDAGCSTIQPLENHCELIAAMGLESGVINGWCYPPMRPVRADVATPSVPSAFSLPATHQIHLTAPSATDEEANFMIAFFGLLKGQRLQRTEWQHFYKAPVASKLNDFIATATEIAKTLDIAIAFWRQQTPEIQKLAFGALHWHLFAQLYEHEFERFNAQYMALDACAKLAKDMCFPGYPTKHPPHAQRASVLCECTGVPRPVWVDPGGGQSSCALALRRNALAHEAMYGGQPVGFAHPVEHRNMELELTGLVARIFLRLLGVSNEYTRSECTTRQKSGFGA